MATTKAPSGLTIARDNMKFTFSWKVSEKDGYAKQHLHYRTNLDAAGKWTSIDDHGTFRGTSKTVTLSAANYYPNTTKKLTRISFRIRAQKSGCSWTAWIQKDLDLAVPNVPSLTAALDGTHENVTTFTWATTIANNDRKPFTNIEWQTRLIKENNETDGSKIAWNSNCSGWATGSGTQNSSNTRTEDTSLLSANAYTRWFRVRSRGPAGASAWRYAKHVYATPYAPVIGTSSYRVLGGGTALSVNINWTAASSASHPIDQTTVEWTIDTPAAGQLCPAGASWTQENISKDTSGKDAAVFTISSLPGVDECLFVRIVTQHDKNTAPSVPRLVKRGTVAAPSNIAVSSDSTTHRATISATNESDITDSQLAVIFRTDSEEDADFVVGVIPHGGSSITVQCPDWTGKQISFGVYAFVGSVKSSTRADGISQYAVTAQMKSDTTWQGGTVPVEPGNVACEIAGEGEIIVTWTWAWDQATRAEISWSENPNAWEATDEPAVYEIPNTHAAKWRISGLATGVKWYVCVRLISEVDGESVYGPYSAPVEADLSSAPNIPALVLSAPWITQDGSITATWGYSSTDGTPQAYAEICEAAVNGSAITYGDVIAHATTQQHVAIPVQDGWSMGESYYLCARVTSESGQVSEWSDPAQVTVVEPLAITITQTSLETIQAEDSEGNARTVTALTEMPLTATITGAGEGGTTSLIIERADEYHMDRPDETTADGYEGETIAIFRQNGEAQISISTDDLIGRLDDGAKYRFIATLEDGYGQSASAEIPFEVFWDHQADIPSGTAVIENGVAKITATAPAGFQSGDFCDIYRLTADRPEAIVIGGEFGTTYVDPYPAIGPHGGHRIVHRTANNDYITADDKPAWADLRAADGDILDVDYAIIDFDGNRLEVRYNTDFSSTFSKDFLETKYLGGSIRGDWNPGTDRKTTVNAVIAVDDLETFETLRRLATYTGTCHVRTQDGSSYAADVQMNDSMTFEEAGKIVTYSLSITRVDTDGLDGMTLEEWEDANGLE